LRIVLCSNYFHDGHLLITSVVASGGPVGNFHAQGGFRTVVIPSSRSLNLKAIHIGRLRLPLPVCIR
jgi:hypothetical protein